MGHPQRPGRADTAVGAGQSTPQGEKKEAEMSSTVPKEGTTTGEVYVIVPHFLAGARAWGKPRVVDWRRGITRPARLEAVEKGNVTPPRRAPRKKGTRARREDA